MTVTPQENQPQQENKVNDKELNFRKQEAMYQKMLSEERQKREEAERRAQDASARKQIEQEDDEDSEPYVDHKRLDKRLSSFEKKLEEKIDRRAEEKARSLLEKEKKDSWIRNNPDFFDILQHAEKFAETNPELAETILEMPEGFERQKLVYKNIKALGLHKPQTKESSVQQKVDANRKSPYYQPSGVGTAPYASMGDFSASGQKQAYQKMQELKNKLRI